MGGIQQVKEHGQNEIMEIIQVNKLYTITTKTKNGQLIQFSFRIESSIYVYKLHKLMEVKFKDMKCH